VALGRGDSAEADLSAQGRAASNLSHNLPLLPKSGDAEFDDVAFSQKLRRLAIERTGIANVIRCYEPRPERRKAVTAFALSPLSAPFELKAALRHVVEDGMIFERTARYRFRKRAMSPKSAGGLQLGLIRATVLPCVACRHEGGARMATSGRRVEAHLELRQLRYFKVVADARSFARGAQALHVAQPALSRSVAKLEEEVGCSLFVRHSAGVSLTDAGARFYQHAMQVLSDVRQLIEATAADGEPQGMIALGAPQSIQSKLVLPVATEFLSRFLRCQLNLIQNSGAHLRHQVGEGMLDLAIVPNMVEGGMHLVPLLRESICLICRPEDRASFGDTVEFGQLLKLPLILAGYPDSLRLILERELQCDTLNVRSEVNSSSMLIELVTRRVGFGVAPGCVVAQRPSELAFVPIQDLEVSWAIATNWHRRGLRAVEALEGLITRSVQDLIERGDWPTARIEA
jgi:LysR family nitrogen assimilation transcriptional regulator